MDEVKKFKSNGDYIKYSPKELIGALHVKFDNQTEKIIDLEKKVTGLHVNVKWLKRLVFALYAFLGSFIIKPVRELFSKIFGG